MPGIADHVFAVALTVLFPLFILMVWYPRFEHRVASDVPGARMAGYRDTMIMEWGLTILAVVLLVQGGRPFEDVGLAAPGGWRFVVGVAVAAAIVAFLTIQYRMVTGDPEKRAAAREQLQSVGSLLPRSRAEMAGFTALSVTAGICEEFLYRGFLIWYLDKISGMLFAVVISSLLFGLGHAYQGSAAIVKTAVVGLVMAGLFVLTESLWVPIALHAFVDVNMGSLGRAVVRVSESGDESPRNSQGGTND
jgi:membrane protease YdiL (CAAX protease family)